MWAELHCFDPYFFRNLRRRGNFERLADARIKWAKVEVQLIFMGSLEERST